MAIARELKPEEETIKPLVLPKAIRPIERSFVEAAEISKIALKTVEAKLPKNDPVRAALVDASNPKNIEKVHVMKGTTPERVYSVEITLNSKPVILTIGIGDRAMVVSLADRQGNPLEDVRQEGPRITINKNPQFAMG
jgi:hypothetical protein